MSGLPQAEIATSASNSSAASTCFLAFVTTSAGGAHAPPALRHNRIVPAVKLNLYAIIYRIVL